MKKPFFEARKEAQQSVGDFLLERLAFSLISGVAGLIYAGVVLVSLYLLKIDISNKALLNSFVVVFGVAGVVFGSRITPVIMSSVYGLMYLWGVLLGFIGHASPFLTNEDFLPKKEEYIWCVALGLLAGSLFIIVRS